MMLLSILALLTVTIQPAAPAVGDRITVTFDAPVTSVDRSEAFEVVEQQGTRVVVRTFEPKPFAMSGTMGKVRFRNLIVPVRSVLKPKDDLTPAPLMPPKPIAYPRLPFVAIGIAAVLAALAWFSAWWASRRKAIRTEPALPADVRFRRTVEALRTNTQPKRWAALADATRVYLAATRPGLGTELTTTELLRRLGNAIVEDILRQGDLEKFSPYGPAPLDFDALASRALELIPAQGDEEVAA
jgi:hypothetical protein